jgi:hypothetical protein
VECHLVEEEEDLLVVLAHLVLEEGEEFHLWLEEGVDQCYLKEDLDCQLLPHDHQSQHQFLKKIQLQMCQNKWKNLKKNLSKWLNHQKRNNLHSRNSQTKSNLHLQKSLQ